MTQASEKFVFGEHQARFLTALMFLTRIPVRVGFSQERLNHAAAYFPLVGLVVGSFGALVYCLASSCFSQALAVLVSMVATVLLTGAFHEDGFADSCDAFWGGWEKADVLRIMKDSRLGTYGVAGLCFILAMKWAALSEMPASLVVLALVSGHVLSRGLAVTYLYDLSYVQDSAASKSKPLARQMSGSVLPWVLAVSVAPLLLWQGFGALWILLVLAVVRMGWKAFLLRRIQGYTGDALGAAQQLFEVTFYLLLCIR